MQDHVKQVLELARGREGDGCVPRKRSVDVLAPPFHWAIQVHEQNLVWKLIDEDLLVAADAGAQRRPDRRANQLRRAVADEQCRREMARAGQGPTTLTRIAATPARR